MSFLAVVLIAFPLSSFAATFDDLVHLNQNYCGDYFELLQYRKSSVASLKQVDAEIAALSPKVSDAKTSYMKQFTAYSALTAERQQAPIRVTQLQGVVTDMGNRDAEARRDAVSQGFFLPNETIDSDSISRKQQERSAAIRGVQDKINALESQIRAIEAGPQFSSLYSERETARRSVAEIENSIAALRRSKSADQDDIDNEQIEINSLIARISSGDARKNDLEQRIIPQLRDALNRLSSDIQNIDNTTSSNEQQISNEQPRLNDARQNWQGFNQRRGELEAQLQQVNNELRDVNSRLDRMQELRRAADDISQSRLPQARNDLQQKNNEAGQSAQAVSEAQSRVNDARNNLNQTSNALRVIQDQRNMVARQLDQARAELNQINQNLARAPELRQRLADIQNKISQTNDQLRAAESEAAMARQEQQDAQARLAAAQREVADLERMAHETERDVQEATQRISKMNDRLTQLRAMLNDNDKIAEEIRQLEGQKSNLESELSRAQSELATAQSGISSAQADLDRAIAAGCSTSPLADRPNDPGNGPGHGDPGHGDPGHGGHGPGGPGEPGHGNPDDCPAVRDAREKLRSAQQRQERAQHEVQRSNEQLQRVTQRIAQLNQSLTDKSGLEAEINRIQNDQLPRATQMRDSKQQELNDLRNKIQNNPNMAGAREALAKADNDARAADAKRNQLTQNLGALNQQKTDTENALNSLAALEQRKSQLESNIIPPLDSQVRTLDQQIADATNRVNGINAQVRDLEGRLQNAASRKQQADQEAQQAQATINQLEQKLAELNRSLTDQPQLQARKQELEGRIIPQAQNELAQVVRAQQEAGQTFERERAQMEALLHRREELSRQRNDLMSRYQANNDEFNLRNREDNDLESQLSSARSSLAQHQTRRSQLEDDLTTVTQSLAQRQSQLAPAQSRQDNAESAFDAYYAQNITPIDNQVSAQNQEKNSLESQVSDLQQLAENLGNFASSIASAKAEIDRLTKRIADLDLEIARLDPILQGLKSVWDQLEAQAKTLADRRAGIMAGASDRLLALKQTEANQDKLVKELAQ